MHFKLFIYVHKTEFFCLLCIFRHFHLFFKMFYNNFVNWSFLREICISISMFHICSNHYFHQLSSPCLHNQTGCAVNLRWLLRHHSCRRKDVWGPVGRERKAGSCHSSSLLSFIFFQQTTTHCLPYSISCARQ